MKEKQFIVTKCVPQGQLHYSPGWASTRPWLGLGVDQCIDTLRYNEADVNQKFYVIMAADVSSVYSRAVYSGAQMMECDPR